MSQWRKRRGGLFAAMGILFAGLVTGHGARAAAACSPASLGGIVGQDARIREIGDWGARNLDMPKGGAEIRNVDGATFCVVTGDMALGTHESGRANFAGLLPQHWNGRILQVGCGGNCGAVFLGAVPLGWVARGYAIWATDDGHVAKPSPSPRLWSVSESSWAQTADGEPDHAKQAAFFFGAVHQLAERARQWTTAYYGSRPAFAYFSGCSDGGREALVEAERYPDDFDGILAGDPYFDIEGEALSALAGVLAQMRAPDAALTDEQWHLADKVILDRCDSADGVKDGLIQNPAQCDFSAVRDLPRCAGRADGACFTTAQAQALDSALSAMTDGSGRAVYPGFPASGLAQGGPMVDNMRYWLGFSTVPGGWHDPASQPQAWYYGNQTMRYLGGVDDPGLRFAAAGGGLHAVVTEDMLARLHRAVGAGDGTDESALDAFFRSGHRLILYHGLSDGDITPYRTLNFYRGLARRMGGYEKLRQHAVLFAVPGMAHCRGGPGPSVFGQSGLAARPADPRTDILASLDDWVRKSRPPLRLDAAHEDETRPRPITDRSMPLCPFPQMARYTGQGDVKDARNWRCEAQDRRMLMTGTAGRAAGYDP